MIKSLKWWPLALMLSMALVGCGGGSSGGGGGGSGSSLPTNHVKNHQGSVEIIRSGQTISVSDYAEVRTGDTIVTKMDSHATIHMGNDVTVRLAEATEFAIKEHQPSSRTTSSRGVHSTDGWFVSLLKKGQAWIDTKVPGNTELSGSNQTCAIGIRGTSYIANVGGCATNASEPFVWLQEG